MNYRLKVQLKGAKHRVDHESLVHMALYAYSNRNTVYLEDTSIADALMLDEREVNDLIHDLHNHGYVDIKATPSGWIYEAKVKVDPAQVQLTRLKYTLKNVTEL